MTKNVRILYAFLEKHPMWLKNHHCQGEAKCLLGRQRCGIISHSLSWCFDHAEEKQSARERQTTAQVSKPAAQPSDPSIFAFDFSTYFDHEKNVILPV